MAIHVPSAVLALTARWPLLAQLEAGAMFVFLVGVAAYRLKKLSPMAYGFMEMTGSVFGGGVAFKRMIELHNGKDLASLTALIGAIYLCSRGLQNVFDGRGPEGWELRHVKAERE